MAGTFSAATNVQANAIRPQRLRSVRRPFAGTMEKKAFLLRKTDGSTGFGDNPRNQIGESAHENAATFPAVPPSDAPTSDRPSCTRLRRVQPLPANNQCANAGRPWIPGGDQSARGVLPRQRRYPRRRNNQARCRKRPSLRSPSVSSGPRRQSARKFHWPRAGPSHHPNMFPFQPQWLAWTSVKLR